MRKASTKRDKNAPAELASRLTWLRQALVDFEELHRAAADRESWNAAVAAKFRAAQIRAEIEEIEQTQAARDGVIRTMTAEEYYDELLATVRAMRSGAMAAGSHVAAVSSIKLEGELVEKRAAASERATAAAREAMTDEAIEAEIARLRVARGMYTEGH